MKITTVGIDLAENVFQVHAVDEHGGSLCAKQLRRDQMTTFFVNLPPCLSGMEACGKLVSKKKLLLLVGEAQELARNKENELMAMRTAITKNSDKLRDVFTGSSRTQLANVFSNSTAPLFSVGAAVQEFPLLGKELVEFVAKKFQVASGRTLDVAAGWTAFQEFHQQPEPFLSVVVAMLMDPSLTFERAVATEKAEQDKE